MTIDPTAAAKAILWLAILGGAVLLATRVLGATASRAAAAV